MLITFQYNESIINILNRTQLFHAQNVSNIDVTVAISRRETFSVFQCG